MARRHGLQKLYHRVENARSVGEGSKIITIAMKAGLLSLGELRAVRKFNITVRRTKPKTLGLLGIPITNREPDRKVNFSQAEQDALKKDMLRKDDD
ncbi:hypothetical protein CL634_01100 [bacterium]|nr:hypothetical protein [bacterium]|tara:strand:+ start:8412 stop:8699 length:288 start_codon:yes stop_codon:yes gene_type:complete